MTTAKSFTSKRLAAALGLGLAVLAGVAQAAATITIQNLNAAGVGFNDPAPAVPVGGNAGTTLGQQRLIAFQAAADQWGATLTSTQTIVIRASFEPLTCTANSAVLGSAGAYNIWNNFAGAGKADTWYPQALANKLSGVNLSAGDPVNGQDIRARFNSRLGLFADCLPGSPFYLGLDNNHGPNIDLVAVLLHEFGHGLGFQTFTDGSTGVFESGLPSIWDHYLLGTVTGKVWKDMTDAERAASALGGNKLVWSGNLVTTALPGVLQVGSATLSISGPAAGPATGDYLIGTASFGAVIGAVPVIGQVMPVVDQANGLGLACNPLTGVNALAVNGRIALVDRGVCGFTVKVKNAQNAGAIGVIVADNAPGSPPPGLGGSDATITIPSVRITQADGVVIKAQLTRRSRTASGVIGRLGLVGSQYAGADALGRALMYTPNPYQPGSSVSHWDTSAFPNQLMEPAINGDLLHSVVPPADLTFRLLQDIGW